MDPLNGFTIIFGSIFGPAITEVAKRLSIRWQWIQDAEIWAAVNLLLTVASFLVVWAVIDGTRAQLGEWVKGALIATGIGGAGINLWRKKVSGPNVPPAAVALLVLLSLPTAARALPGDSAPPVCPDGMGGTEPCAALTQQGAPLAPPAADQPRPQGVAQPPPAIVAPTASQSVAPPPAGLFGATAWQGGSGPLEAGVAIPLTVWPSVFHYGTGELVALLGKSSAGLGIGHRFRTFRLEIGGVSMGAALGAGGVIPYNQTCPPGKLCRSGFRAAHAVAFITLPLSPK